MDTTEKAPALKAEDLRPDQVISVSEFLTMTPRDMDGYFAERALGYTRIPCPKDGAGENGGDPILVPPGGIPDGYCLPPKGRIGFAFMAPVLGRDHWGCDKLRTYMGAFRYSLECGGAVTATFTHHKDGRRGSYRMSSESDEPTCALVAACLALGILRPDSEVTKP